METIIPTRYRQKMVHEYDNYICTGHAYWRGRAKLTFVGHSSVLDDVRLVPQEKDADLAVVISF